MNRTKRFSSAIAVVGVLVGAVLVLPASAADDPASTPTVTVNQGTTQADPTSTSPIVYDIEFSEDVTGLTAADFSSTGTTAGGTLTLALAGSGTTYTASISGMTTEGNVVLTLPAGAAQDADGNGSAASTATDNTVKWNPPPPPSVSVNQGSTQGDPTSVSPIVYDVVFSEPVTGLSAADFSSTGTTAGGTLVLALAGSGATYTASISGMTTAGDVVLTLPAGAAQNGLGVSSTASTATDNTVQWNPAPGDTTPPTVTVNQGSTQADPTGTSPIVYDVVFSEPVTGLSAADFSSTGTTVGGTLVLALAGSGSTYTASISGMTTAGDVVLTLPAGAAQDAAGNGSTASSSVDNTVAWVPGLVTTTTSTTTSTPTTSTSTSVPGSTTTSSTPSVGSTTSSVTPTLTPTVPGSVAGGGVDNGTGSGAGTSTPTGILPRTGSNPGALALTGFGLLLAGTAELLVLRRRRLRTR